MLAPCMEVRTVPHESVHSSPLPSKATGQKTSVNHTSSFNEPPIAGDNLSTYYIIIKMGSQRKSRVKPRYVQLHKWDA